MTRHEDRARRAAMLIPFGMLAGLIGVQPGHEWWRYVLCIACGACHGNAFAELWFGGSDAPR
jgi:hypothetical protein